MQYELYIDIFFLIIFLMDYLLLLTVRHVLKWNCTHFRVILSAAIGALGSALLLFVNMPEGIKQIILHFGGSLLMINIAFGFHGRRLVYGWSIFYFAGMLMGGVFMFISQYLRKSVTEISLFICVAAGTYFLTRQILDYMEIHTKRISKKYNVTLHIGTEDVAFSALFDSGNMLKDRLSGREVHIISSKGVKKFTNNIPVMRYIAYQTVQGESKTMPLIKGDRMYIHGKKEQLIENPYFAVSECVDFGNGDNEIILHPDCIQEV